MKQTYEEKTGKKAEYFFALWMIFH
jgi:hypothetical protein